jgi:hypothetical protein
MAKLKTLSVSQTGSFANPAAAGDQPIRKNEFDVTVNQINTDKQSLSELIIQLRAEFDANVASVLLQLIALATEDEALSQLIIALRAEFEANVASVGLQLTALSTADATLAELIATLRADFQGNVSSVLLQLTALSTAISAEATLRLELKAAFDTQVATFNTILTTLATKDAALTSSIQTLTATAAGLSAAITIEATARATALGELYTRYSIMADVNGRVAGFELLNGTGIQSSFIIRADVFGVVNPDYPNNTLPSRGIGSGQPAARFQTNYGTGAANVFKNVNGVMVARAADVWSMGSFIGAGNGSGFSAARLRKAGSNRFVARYAGQCKYLSVWYRIPSLGSHWNLMAAAGWLAPETAAEDFHPISGFNQNDIAVGALDTIEFGFNGLDGFAAGNATDSKNDIWGGSLMVEVDNF